MTVIVSILLVAALLTVLAVFVFIVAAALRWVSAAARPLPRRATLPKAGSDPSPFGALPTLSDPVGPLGNPAPSADLSSTAESERDIYGE